MMQINVLFLSILKGAEIGLKHLYYYSLLTLFKMY